jgi:hypothetical protein
MAETSGFFDAEWDNSIEASDGSQGDYDRRYSASQWANYFNKFICNGVYGNPTDQCRVRAGNGMNIIISSGSAFINGYWYNNDEDLIISVPSNTSGSSRTDSVRLRFDDTTRQITAQYFSGDIDNLRNDIYYDLKLAEIIVPSSAVEIATSNITDTRTNENVCGFVTGLLEVQTTKDLFEQYGAIFNEWFDDVKDQVTGDLAVKLQTEFTQINEDIKKYKDDVAEYDENVTNSFNKLEEDIAQYKNDIDNSESEYQTQIQNTISEYKKDTEATIKEYQEEITQISDETKQVITDFIADDFVIAKQKLTFTNKICTITNDKVTEDSLIDVYFTKDSMNEAIRSVIFVDSETGKIVLTAERQPESDIYAVIRVRVK